MECKGSINRFAQSGTGSINGTKVECKEYETEVERYRLSRINGTKVECKGDRVFLQVPS